MKKKQIVILGGGFGGIYTAKKLAKKLSSEKFEITLVDRRNYFLFTPLLHEVAAATIDDKVPVESIASLLKAKIFNWLVASVQSVDVKNKVVVTDRNNIKYDYLVVALGATTQTYGVKGVEEFASDLKSLGAAIDIKNRLIANFELANLEKDKKVREELLSVSVVGAGPTGIELAGEISDFVQDVTKYYFDNIKFEDVKLRMFNSSEKILTMCNPKLGIWSEQYLNDNGWNLIKNAKVTKLSKNKIHTADEVYSSGLIVWSAGVKPNVFESEFVLDDRNRILVNDFLQVKGSKDVFALGDIAAGSPMLAQVAVQQAGVVSENLLSLIAKKKKKLKSFKYFDKGFLLSIGKWKAVGEVFGVPIKGPIVWVMWHAVYFFKFVSVPKKIKVLLDWFLHVFRVRDISSY
jgi:NADH dehydrogenase